MKYALVDIRREGPRPNMSGDCPVCGTTVIARCGDIRVWHWAHKGRRHCDSWWENESEWHRNWKGEFPVDWQEIVHHAENRERHIADVKTEDDWVIEFQHSYIKPEERQSREGFYKKLVWVVDGVRRKTDVTGFQRALNEGTQIGPSFPGWRVSSNEGALLRNWAESRVHVFFDFGDGQWLWWLSPATGLDWSYVVRISRAKFIALHRRSSTQGVHDFHSFAESLTGQVSDYESDRRAQAMKDFRIDFAHIGKKAHRSGRFARRRYRL